MIPLAILLLLVFILLCLIRVILGPTILDRIAAADAIGVLATTVLVLLSLVFQRGIFVDIAIVYALLLFADLLIISKYFERRKGDKT